MKFEQALEHIDAAMVSKLGRSLRDPERLVLQGTWRGWTYEQMADASEYSTNYLMRDIAPKLWKRLSEALEQQVSKTNFKITLERRLGVSVMDDGLLSIPKVTSSNPISTPPVTPGSSSSDWVSLVAREDEFRHPPVDLINFYGYEAEQAQLSQWLTTDNTNVVGVFGLCGTGKTTLVQKVLQEGSPFEQVVWRSLRHAPPLTELLRSLPLISTENADEAGLTLKHLLDWFKQQSVALVLDDLEALLQPEEQPGQFRPGREDYAELLRYIATETHQSCIIFTTLEMPQVMRQIADKTSQVQHLRLEGLSESASHQLLESLQLNSPEAWPTLIQYYEGHPRALKAIARLITELMNGNAAEFAAQNRFVLQDVDTAITATFDRLSPVEREIMYWLASRPTAVSLAELSEESPYNLDFQDILSVLDSLKQRSLIETLQVDGKSLFALKPMILEYVLNQFVSQFREDDSNLVAARSSSFSRPGQSIRLTTTANEPTALATWFQHEFRPAWQSLETLFDTKALPAWRFRSTYSLRDKDLVKRYKVIPLSANNEPYSIALIIAIAKDTADSVRVCVQAQSAHTEVVLPTGLSLNLLNAEGTQLASITAYENDNFIQLPDFYGQLGETFGIQLALGESTQTENFVL